MKRYIQISLSSVAYTFVSITILFLIKVQDLHSYNSSKKGESMQSKLAESKRSNRLINEKSPYLLQHAENPVDWFAWCDEAFEKAKKENKPIFLSIGYSTCHWCHVMAHESFEDPEVAKLLNETFICIKVDREERPDIDNIYMTVCQMMTGSGGWPLTIFMTPDKKPFYAGTYFPKESRFQRPGMVELIPKIKKIWEENHDDVLKSASDITARLQSASENTSGNELNLNTLNTAFGELSNRFDTQYGGFGKAPKFPSPQNLLFLLRYWKRNGERIALQMVEKTLYSMRNGGIYDHIGFGFHRYSTDQEWLVPHFEKMLYDQAMLALAYTETFQATKKEEYKNVAREIFEYVLRDMTFPNGGFYSAEDADSEGEEGKFYVWTEDEIKNVVKKEDLDTVLKVFNVQKKGNFREGFVNEGFGLNILYFEKPVHEIAFELKMPEKKLVDIIENARQKLYEKRIKRVFPHKDDKILTDWNGLMIAALAKGARVFGVKEYEVAATKAIEFVLKNMLTLEGRLLHRYRDGEAAISAHIDDYAFLIWGLIELYETTFNVDYLKKAVEFNNDLIKHFWDKENGGFYFTADDGEKLLFRQKEIYDGAIPSGNSVAMSNLLRLGRISASTDLENMAMKISTVFSKNIQQYPAAYAQLLVGLDFGLGPSFELVIVGTSETEDFKELIKSVYTNFIPNKVILFKPTGSESLEITKIAPFTKDMKAINKKVTVYVCLDFACKNPTTDVNQMLKLLNVVK